MKFNIMFIVMKCYYIFDIQDQSVVFEVIPISILLFARLNVPESRGVYLFELLCYTNQ